MRARPALAAGCSRRHLRNAQRAARLPPPELCAALNCTLTAPPAPGSFESSAATFLNLLGFTLAGPLTPELGTHFDLAGGAAAGSLTSAYPLGMLLALVLWPPLSDRIGRKPVIVCSLLGVGVGLCLQALAVAQGWPLWAFLGLRAASGACAGASPVAKAYLADVGDEDTELPKWMAWREAANTLAFIVGPVLGGCMFVGVGLEGVIATSGAASLTAALAVALVLQEPTPARDGGKQDGGAGQEGDAQVLDGPSAGDDADRRGDLSDILPPEREPEQAATSLSKAGDADYAAAAKSGLGAMARVPVSCPLGRYLWHSVLTICVISALYHVGQVSWDAFFGILMRERFGIVAGQLGAMMTVSACVSFGVSTACFGPVERRLGLAGTSVLGLSLVGLGLVLVGSAYSPFTLIPAMACYAIGVPLFSPTVPILLLKCVPPTQRGAVMGLDSALNSASRVVSPLAIGAVYHGAGAQVAFTLVGAILWATAAATAARAAAVKQQRTTSMSAGRTSWN